MIREGILRDSLQRRKIRGLHVDAFYSIWDGEGASGGFFGGGFGFDPGGVRAESGKGGEASFFAGVRQDVDQFCCCTFVCVSGCPIADVGHAVLGEETHRVIAEPAVQSVQFALDGVVDAQLKGALLFRHTRLHRHRVIGGFQEDRLRCFGQQLSIGLACLPGLLPLRVLTKRSEAGLGSLTTFVGEDLVKRGLAAVLRVHRHPEADVLHPVLFKKLAGVIAETGQQFGKLAGRSSVDA